jgi:hypothetical protein
MINSLEVGYEALLKFFPLVSCILNKKETRRSQYLLFRRNKLPGRSSNKKNMSLYDTICHDKYERKKTMGE